MAPRKRQGPCAVIGCGKPIETREWCEEHYYRLWKFGRLHKVNTGTKRNHPLYSTWNERKLRGGLVPEWLDFFKFVADVGEKPSPRHFLVRLTEGPYGPNNFAWVERLKRRAGESAKDWYARKWAQQRQAHPHKERRRDLYRKYGLTIEQYDQMAEAQNNVCAICKRPEFAIDTIINAPKRLSVDHCHTSGKVRELLCWRCNGVLGKIEDDPQLLETMASYLRRHA